MRKDLEVIIKFQESVIEALDRRVRYCESVASQYEQMFKQLQMEMRAISDRQGNIQQVYDYMTRIGSQIAVKNPDRTAFLSPIRKELPMDETKKLELMSKFKFKVGDEVWYADEALNWCHKHTVQAIDIIDRHPRYCLENIFGYVDESKLFSTEEQAQWQLDEWKRSL
jgi:hypothetical protein